MVTLDHGQPDGEVIDDIRVWVAHAQDAGLPVVRFVHPRATGLLRALARANADVYVQSCAGVATGFTGWSCRRRGAAFIYRVANDLECVPGKQYIQYARDRKLYEYGLRRADVVVAQSRTQQELLSRNYGLASEIGGSLVESRPAIPAPEDREIDVLWVGAIRPLKRPGLVLELARQLPGRRIRIVGGPDSKYGGLYHRLENEAAALGNCEWMGVKPYRVTQEMFPRARVLISTSETEGFPNTYLQAWMAGTPVVAFFDPDGLLTRQGLGLVVGTLEEAGRAVEKLLSDPEELARYSERVRAYAQANHGVTIVDRYESVVMPLLHRRAA